MTCGSSIPFAFHPSGLTKLNYIELFLPEARFGREINKSTLTDWASKLGTVGGGV